MFFGWFKKRQKDDISRLITAYRYFLKAGEQSGGQSGGSVNPEERKWKGGFGKTCQQLYKDWPSSNESRLFEKKMERWVKKSESLEQAYILAFNDYLNQKRLRPEELSEIIGQGHKAFYR